MRLETPYYLIDERALLRNLRVIRRVRERSGARAVLATKCFSSWAVFGLMRRFMDGTTSSSLFEARLGHEKFGGETHAYCVGWKRDEILAVRRFASKIIFNSADQLERFRADCGDVPLGIRINPGVSYSHFDLADPARRNSRLGVRSIAELRRILPHLSGAMFHCNCENDDFAAFARLVRTIGRRFGLLLRRLRWVSLGGGIYFTKPGYPVDEFCALLRDFARRFGVQVYLEPGETAITRCAHLVTTVVDIVPNRTPVAVVDASTEAHMLDLLIYRTPAKMDLPAGGRYRYQVAGRSCLAGDVFGTYRFPRPLRVGDTLRIADAAGYSIVKKNWFNGLAMPAIAVRRSDGRIAVVRRFGYDDFVNNLS
jgi:carboxynorspermidine decarboxylase